MAICVVIQFTKKYSLVLFFYYKFYNIFHKYIISYKILQFPLTRVSFVNYRLGHVIYHRAIRP